LHIFILQPLGGDFCNTIALIADMVIRSSRITLRAHLLPDAWSSSHMPDAALCRCSDPAWRLLKWAGADNRMGSPSVLCMSTLSAWHRPQIFLRG